MRDPTRPGMTREEGLALGIAIAAHGALIAALTLSPPGKDIQPPPQRMTVTFSEEVADKSTSPDPMAQAAPDVAPQLGEPAPETASEPQPQPQPAPPQPAPVPPPPQPAPQPRPQPPQPAPRPVPVPKPAPRPQPAPAKPAPKPQPAPAKPVPAKAAPAKPAPAKAAAPGNDAPRRRPDAPSGASRIGSDFLKGIPGSTAPGTSKTPPAQAAGPAVVSSLVSAISRQIKPHWAAPQGVDADKLVTVLAWSLNADGTLAGRPTVVSQSGVTDANRAQAQRHAEQAIRAVQLAAPFDLPAPYYSSWKRVSQFRFDRKLSQ